MEQNLTFILSLTRLILLRREAFCVSVTYHAFCIQSSHLIQFFISRSFHENIAKAAVIVECHVLVSCHNKFTLFVFIIIPPHVM